MTGLSQERIGKLPARSLLPFLCSQPPRLPRGRLQAGAASGWGAGPKALRSAAQDGLLLAVTTGQRRAVDRAGWRR